MQKSPFRPCGPPFLASATLLAAFLDQQAKPPDPDLPVNVREAFWVVNRNTHIHIAPDERALSSKIRAAQIELHGEYVLGGGEYQSSDTNTLGKEVDYQGSRQLDNFSRRYYEKELGAGIGPSPGFSEMFGYTEPFRRFVQHETFSPQANEIPNQAASWLPGDDYYVNFHEGDPYIKVDEGYARLPGAGYEALHPELKDINPEDYPDIHKMSILADVAPYSREYHTYRQKVGRQAQGNTELEIEYEKILTRVKKTRESVIKMNDRHFTAPVDEISGTVDEVSAGGITLNEFPGRRFQFSSVSTSAADMSARILGENNNLTRSEVAAEVDTRRGALQEYLANTFTSGDTARLVIPKGAAASSEQIRAVVLANGENVNRELIDRGYREYREDLGGAEARAMHGVVGRHLGSMAEGLAFQGDSGPFNPMRYQGSPSCRTQRTSCARDGSPAATHMPVTRLKSDGSQHEHKFPMAPQSCRA
jgi:hypothetical protein